MQHWNEGRSNAPRSNSPERNSSHSTWSWISWRVFVNIPKVGNQTGNLVSALLPLCNQLIYLLRSPTGEGSLWFLLPFVACLLVQTKPRSQGILLANSALEGNHYAVFSLQNGIYKPDKSQLKRRWAIQKELYKPWHIIADLFHTLSD